MELNPRDYDLRELRQAAGTEGDGGGPRRRPEVAEAGRDRSRRGAAGADPTRFESEEAELAYAELAGEVPRERPYLRSLPGGSMAEVLVFRWLEYLVERADIQGTLTALRYYRDIEWLTETAENQLRDYLGGLDEPPGDAPGLAAHDHRTSLRFLTKLAALDSE
jgi:flagellar protein FlaE